MKLIPYPLSAASISVRFIPFGWSALHFHKQNLTQQARETGETLWYLRVGPIQISYNRMV